MHPHHALRILGSVLRYSTLYALQYPLLVCKMYSDLLAVVPAAWWMCRAQAPQALDSAYWQQRTTLSTSERQCLALPKRIHPAASLHGDWVPLALSFETCSDVWHAYPFETCKESSTRHVPAGVVFPMNAVWSACLLHHWSTVMIPVSLRLFDHNILWYHSFEASPICCPLIFRSGGYAQTALAPAVA